MLLGGVKNQIPKYLKPQSDGAVGCAGSEKQGHLLTVPLAEVTWI